MTKKAQNNPMINENKRVYKFMLSPRCGARARTNNNNPCRLPAMRNRTRCRLHGGKSSGPPKGNQNALKDGEYTREAIAERREIKALIKKWRELENYVNSI